MEEKFISYIIYVMQTGIRLCDRTARAEEARDKSSIYLHGGGGCQAARSSA